MNQFRGKYKILFLSARNQKTRGVPDIGNPGTFRNVFPEALSPQMSEGIFRQEYKILCKTDV